MTKAFNEKEKEIIRNQLIEKGKELFGRYGLKKTSIDELTRAVGIAQGSFYTFFGSKEELYFEIIEREQENFHGVAESLLDPGGISRNSLKKLLTGAFEYTESNAVIRTMFERGEYERLMRLLPPEKVRQHISGDVKHFRPLIVKLQEEGKMIPAKPETIIGLFIGLFAIPFFRKEIGEDIYPEVFELLCDIIARGLIKDKEN